MYLLCSMVMVFFLPCAGVLFFLVLAVLKRFHKEIDTRRLEDLAEDDSQTAAGYLRKADFSKEADIVPLNDALEINSDSEVRKMVLDILKEDAFSYMEYLEKALEHKDTEISHYAATAVLDIQRKLMLTLQEFSVRYEKERDNAEVLTVYNTVLKDYLSSRLIDEQSRMKYKGIQSRVLGDLLKIRPEPSYFVDKIDLELELKDYNKAYEYCSIFLKMYPCLEEPYLMNIKYYYIMKDSKKLKDMVVSLKNSNCAFSSKALETVRYWGVGYEK